MRISGPCCARGGDSDRRRQDHATRSSAPPPAARAPADSIPAASAAARRHVDALVLEDVVADIGRLAVVQPDMPQRVALRMKAVDPRRVVLQQRDRLADDRQALGAARPSLSMFFICSNRRSNSGLA
jgi:hypothetical protein